MRVDTVVHENANKKHLSFWLYRLAALHVEHLWISAERVASADSCARPR